VRLTGPVEGSDVNDAEVTRFSCPHCGTKIKARLAPTVKGVRCPNASCGKRILVPEQAASEGSSAEPSAPPTGDAFAWSTLQPDPPARARPSTSSTDEDGNHGDRKNKPNNQPRLILVGLAAGVLLVVVAVAVITGVISPRKPAPRPAAEQNQPHSAQIPPRPDVTPSKTELKPPLTIEIVRSEPEKPAAGDDLRVWLRGGRPNGKAPLFQYRTDPHRDWQTATGDVVHLPGVSAGAVTLQLRAVEGEDSASIERTWVVEQLNRPPMVAIARTSPEKPRPGGSFLVQLKSQHPKGEAVTFQYRTSREGDWIDAAGDAVSLLDLKPGELRLEVRSRDQQGWTSRPLVQDWVVPTVAVTREPARKYKGHRTCSHAVTFTPDGQMFLSGSCDQTLKLWDTNNPDIVVEFEGVRGQIYAVDVSSDGKYAVTGGFSLGREAGAIGALQLWDMETYKEIRQLSGHANIVTSVKFSPDGTFLASGSHDGTVRLWEVKTGREIRRLEEAGSTIMAVAFSGDGTRLVSAGVRNREGVIRQWDVGTGEQLTQIASPSGRVTGVAFLNEARIISSSGRIFVQDKFDVDSQVRVWDMETKKESGSFLGNEQGVSSLVLSFDRKYVFCASGDGTMQLREVEGGGEVQRFEGHKKKVLCVAISRNSHYVVTGSEDGQLLLWDLPREVHIPEK
jgi:WD40 repeat protein